MHQATSPPHRRSRRSASVVSLTLLALLTLTGCVRVQAAFAVSESDLVSGQLVVAAVAIKQGDTGPVLKVAPELVGKVRTEQYTADGYVGQTVSFQDLTFAEVTLLGETITVGKQYRLNFRRAGQLVTLSGAVDLTELPPDRADVQLKVAFPGSVTRTNGVNEDGTISWKPRAGAVTELNATVEYSDKSTVSWTKWVTMVGGGAVGVALLVLVLALVTHRRALRREGPPTAEHV